MFFLIAVMPVEKRLPYPFSGICQTCGKVCGYEVYMSASCLSLFFIPLIKFGKKYIVKVDCCQTVYLLNKEKGRKIERGENVMINENDLTPYIGDFSIRRSCPNCGYEVEEDFIHCPKCGKKL